MPLAAGKVPFFGACGVMSQAVAVAAKIDLMLTHASGHMCVTDLRDEDLATS